MFPEFVAVVIFYCCPSIDNPGLTLPVPTNQQIELIKKLGSNEFNVREQTQENLEKMDSELYKALVDAIKNNPDPEIRARCNQILPKVMRYNVPAVFPSLHGLYNTKVKFKSGKILSINKDIFQKYLRLALANSDDSYRNTLGVPLAYITYLLPKASHYLFTDMRLYGYSKEDIDELINLMKENINKINKSSTFAHWYEWLK